MGEIIYGGGGGGGGGGELVSIGGNTDGTAALISTGTLYIMGGNNVTISQDGNSLTVQGETNSGATTFLAGVSNLGNSLGTTGAVNQRLAFVGGNNITLSASTNAGNSGTITISGPNAQTGISSIQGSDTTYTSGKVIFTGAGIVTVQSGAGQSLVFNATVPAVSMGVSTFGNTDGTTGTVSNRIVFVGGSNVTLSQSSAAGGASVTINAVQATGFLNSISVEGNTAGDVTAGTGRLVLAGGNNVTLSGATAAGVMTLTISAGASGGGGGIGASIGGNSTSAGAGYSNVTSGTVVLMGGNNITLSQNGASVTISGANAGGAQTGISSIQASDATYTSGKVIFTGAGAVTVSSGANQSVIINAPVQSVQTESRFNLTLAGNTAGALADISSGVMTLAGGNGITVSQLNNAVTISGPTPREAVTIAGNSTSAGAGYTLVSTGTLVLAGGNNITLSQNGHSITISGANAGGAQTGISSISVSDTVYTSGQVKFTGSGNVTVMSGTGQQVIISVPSGGGAGVSSLGNTAGTTGTVDYQLVFVGGSNISLSQSVDGSSGTITINGGGGTGGGFALNAGGNTTGTTAQITGGTLTLAGGNNITLSQVGSAITISGANAGGAQTGISSIIGSDATYTSGAVVFSGTNNITVASGTGQVVLISGPTGGGAGMGSQGNTAGTTGSVGRELYFVGGSNVSLSQSVNGGSATLTINAATAGGGQTAISGIIASDATYTSGTVSFVGNGIVTVRTGTGQQVIIDASGGGGGFTAGMGASGNTAGTGGQVPAQLVIVGTNNISLSQSINASSATITLNVIVPILSLGVSSSGNTSGNTGTVNNALVLVGGNNVTLSQNTDASGATVVISGPSGGGAGMGNSANTSGTSGSVGKELYFYGGANISLSQSVNGSSGSLWIVGASGGGAGFSGGMSTEGNTAGTAGTVDRHVVFVGGSNVTLSQSVNASSATITIIGAAQALALKSAGISTNGNTAGTTGFATAEIMFVGGNNITLSQSLNNGSVSLSIIGAAAGGGGATVNGSTGNVSFAAGNLMSLSTAGSTLTYINVLSSSAIAQPVSNVSSAGTLASRFALADHAHVGVAGLNASGTASTFVGNVMLSVANLTLVTGGNSSAGSIGISGPVSHSENTLSQWMPPGMGVSTFQQIGQSSLVMFPAIVPARLNISRADIFVSNSVSTSSNSSHQATLSLALGIYTLNASTLSLATSGSVSYTWNVTGSTSSGSVVGMRGFSIPIAATFQPGDHFIGFLSQTASANANWVTLSNLALQPFASAYSGLFGATNASNQLIPGLGIFTAQTAALPASVALSGLQASSAATARPVINFLNYTA